MKQFRFLIGWIGSLLLIVSCSDAGNNLLSGDGETEGNESPITDIDYNELPDGDSDAGLGCLSHLDCRSDQYCDPDAHICKTRECTVDSDCLLGFICDDFKCVPGVRPDGDEEISPEEEVIPEEDIDREEAAELDAPSETEEESPDSCEPGEKTCLGDLLATCQPDGITWETEACEAGQTCLVDQCVDRTCEPDETGDCASEFTFWRCNSHGTGMEEIPCPEHQYCEEGECLPIVCEPDAEIGCVDQSTVKKCTSEGNDWYTENCPEDTLCVGEGCAQVICEPGTSNCEDNRLYFCNALGTIWEEFQNCTEINAICDSGTCKPKICEPGVKTCDETDLQLPKQCNESGTGWDLLESCTGTNECRGGDCLGLCDVAAYDRSYVGCDYWPVDLQNDGREDGGFFSVVVSNPQSFAVNVTVSTEAGVLQTKQIAAGGLDHFDLGSSRLLSDAGLFKRAYHLHADAPITATQMNPFGNTLIYSNDASLLVPEGALGLEYIGLTWPTFRRETCSCPTFLGFCVGDYECEDCYCTGISLFGSCLFGEEVCGWGGRSGFLAVVATQPGTTSVTVNYKAASRSGTGVAAEAANAQKTYSLSQFDVLNLESADTDCPDQDIDGMIYCYGGDLTGSSITASQKVAVYGGHVGTFIPQNQWAADHIEHQLFPIDTWGKDYIAVRTEPRGAELDYYKIVASEDGTDVTLSPDPTGQSPRTMSKGASWLFSTSSDFSITATKPIMVGHFLAGQDATGMTLGNSCNTDADCPARYVCCVECNYACSPEAGDPAMMLLAPNGQFRNSYIFLVPPNYKYDYITIVAPNDATLTLDGGTPMSSSNFVTVNGSFRRLRMNLADGVHRLESDKPIGLYVYGYSAFVSYAYTGGLDLKALNPKP